MALVLQANIEVTGARYGRLCDRVRMVSLLVRDNGSFAKKEKENRRIEII